MLSQTLLYFAVLAGFCTAAVIPLIKPNDILNEPSEPRFPEKRPFMNDEMQLYSKEYNEKASAVLLSYEELSKNKLQSLGVSGSILSVLTKGIETSDNFFLPFNSKSVFMLETESSVLIGKDNISMMMPFDINGDYLLKDVNLLIPRSFLNRYGLWNLTRPGGHEIFDGAFFRNESKPLNFDSPVLIMIFKEDNSLTKGMSKMFFDKFALIWVNSRDSTDLLHSVFCSVHGNSTFGACLKVNDGNRQIFVYPSYTSLQKREINFNGFFGPFLVKREVQDSNTNDPDFAEGQSTKEVFEIQLDDSEPQANENSYANITDCLQNGEPVALNDVETDDEFEIPANRPPRNPHYSQVIYPDLVHVNSLSLSKRGQKETNCEPITWTNLFRHALFGSPSNFCT